MLFWKKISILYRWYAHSFLNRCLGFSSLKIAWKCKPCHQTLFGNVVTPFHWRSLPENEIYFCYNFLSCNYLIIPFILSVELRYLNWFVYVIVKYYQVMGYCIFFNQLPLKNHILTAERFLRMELNENRSFSPQLCNRNSSSMTKQVGETWLGWRHRAAALSSLVFMPRSVMSSCLFREVPLISQHLH